MSPARPSVLCRLAPLLLALAVAGPARADGDDDDGPTSVEEDRVRDLQTPVEATTPDEDRTRAMQSPVFVDGATEWAPALGYTVKNWRLRKLDPSQWPDMVKHVVNTQDMFAAGTATRRDLDTIVLHETGAPKGFARLDAGVHFLVDHDATIFQLGDLAKRFDHASNGVINGKSIGIELAVGSGGAHIFNSDAPGRLKIQWRASGRFLVLPTADQLEADFKLVEHLLTKYPGVPRRVINASIAPGYFFLNSNTKPLDPKKPPAVEPVEVGGIVSHSIVRGHPDGAAEAVYIWLRLEQKLDDADAYATMKEILALPPIDVAKTPAVSAKVARDVWGEITVVDPYAVGSGKLGTNPHATSGGGASDDDDAPARAARPVADDDRPTPTVTDDPEPSPAPAREAEPEDQGDDD